MYPIGVAYKYGVSPLEGPRSHYAKHAKYRHFFTEVVPIYYDRFYFSGTGACFCMDELQAFISHEVKVDEISPASLDRCGYSDVGVVNANYSI